MDVMECSGFIFFSNFDSGNLARVELVKRKENNKLAATSYNDEPDYEFNLWTRPDCAGTAYENGNRTWFYFGIKAGENSHCLVKLNLVDLNKQAKMYGQGMAPVTRTIPGKAQWERVKDRVTFTSNEVIFTLSFRFFTPENIRTTTLFAFTYPYTYTDLQSALSIIDSKYLTVPAPAKIDDIYYVRESICKSIEGRRIDLITISSYHNITFEKEPRLKNLFKDTTVARPFKFHDKKVIFVSARVHPGETPSTFVFNGFLNFLLSHDDLFAMALRRLYVFKLIPFLNPDGVARGHYRTDTKGVNLNRVYLSPSLTLHPSIYAARSLIRYHHYGEEIPDPDEEILSGNKVVCVKCQKRFEKLDMPEQTVGIHYCHDCQQLPNDSNHILSTSSSGSQKDLPIFECKDSVSTDCIPAGDSGLFLYIDLHGHASKKGIFMYGNHFQDDNLMVECMLLPRIMALNNQNFHFHACNFTERNMYLKDRRDGLSREGSGRVAVLKMTGLIRSYTLECNYNTGRLVNNLPPTQRDGITRGQLAMVPPKFTPAVYEEVGRAFGPSILDLTGDNPNSRLPNSEYHSLSNMREWLKNYLIGQNGGRTSNLTGNSISANKSNTQTCSSGYNALNQTLRRLRRRQRWLNRRNAQKKVKQCAPMIQTQRGPALKKSTKPSRLSLKSANLKKSNTSSPLPSGSSGTGSRLNESDRKENIYNNNNSKLLNQGCCSSTSTARSQLATKFTVVKNKEFIVQQNNEKNTTMNRSLNLLFRNPTRNSLSTKKTTPAVDSSFSTSAMDVPSGSNPKLLSKTDSKRFKLTPSRRRITESSSSHGPSISTNTAENRMKIREICMVKTEFGKQVVAKYDNPCGSTSNDDLIIKWNNSGTAEVFTNRPKTKKQLQIPPRPPLRINRRPAQKIALGKGHLKKVTKITKPVNYKLKINV